MMDARWRIVPDPSTLAEAAAQAIVATIQSSGEAPAICLTGGSTPRRLYDLLGHWASRIPWARVHWFVGDERFVADRDPRSNLGEARRLFLDRRAPKGHIHAVPTDVADVHAAAQIYEAELRAFGAGRGADALFDLVLLGVGQDGHVASLFPGSAAIKERSKLVVGVDRAALPPFLPRITLTMDALSSCRALLIMAEGASKAPILSRVATGEDLPATQVTSRQGALWLVDEAAAPPVDALGPRLVLVMGVSGSGKTTMGGALASRLGWSFLDADDLHSDANIAKMQSGSPLTDEDRAPWLGAVRDELVRRKSLGEDVVLACSALKRHYRNVILPTFTRSRIVHLRGPAALIAARLERRHGHFMPAALLDDQLNVLEQPSPEEGALVFDVVGSVAAQVNSMTGALRPFVNAGRLERSPIVS